eukprot:gene19174-19547_t
MIDRIETTTITQETDSVVETDLLATEKKLVAMIRQIDEMKWLKLIQIGGKAVVRAIHQIVNLGELLPVPMIQDINEYHWLRELVEKETGVSVTAEAIHEVEMVEEIGEAINEATVEDMVEIEDSNGDLNEEVTGLEVEAAPRTKLMILDLLANLAAVVETGNAPLTEAGIGTGIDRQVIAEAIEKDRATIAVRGSEGSSEQQLPAHLQKLTAEVTREAGIAGASAEQKAAEDAKNSKAAKAQAREEADRRSKETKEAAALREKELALQREAQMTNVTEEDRRGILGTVLMKVAIEKCGLEDVASSKWWTKDQFGSALSGLLEGRFSAQVAALYIVQGYCERHKFPASVGGKSGKLIEQLFNILLSAQVIEPEGFFAWADDEAGADSPGRLEAVVQTSGFLLKLKELLQDEIGDEEEEVDRPREIVK